MSYRRRPNAFLGDLLAQSDNQVTPMWDNAEDVDPVEYIDPGRMPEYESK
jgi:hypothetical protein